MIEQVKPTTGGGNKPWIHNTAEGDKHRADGEFLFFFSAHVNSVVIQRYQKASC